MLNTNDHIDDGLKRLNEILPLALRQRALAPELIAAHRLVLTTLAQNGRIPSSDELKSVLSSASLPETLTALATNDLVVLKDQQLVGAYPMTTEKTTHCVEVFGNTIHAMCALDALSVASLFDTDTIIDSRCAMTQETIHIEQTNLTILSALPPSPVIGIRWQDTCGHAAHSLCMEMVFLKDQETAKLWQDRKPELHSLYTLDEALIFGQRFFSPLLENANHP